MKFTNIDPIHYYEFDYQKHLEKKRKRTMAIEQVLNNNGLFLRSHEKYLRGMVHKSFMHYHARGTLEEKKVLHIVTLIQKGNSVSQRQKSLSSCTCEICLSLISRPEKIDRYIRKLNRRPSFKRRQEIEVLLWDEPITEKNISHCIETKIQYLQYGDSCDCNLHKGRFQKEFVFYFEPFLKGEGPLEPEWIRAYRKDQMFQNLRNYILYAYEIEAEDLDKRLCFNKIICFSDLEVDLVKDLSFGVQALEYEAEDLPLGMIRIKATELLEKMHQLRQKLRTATKRKLININSSISALEQELVRMNQNPEKFEENMYQFTDNLFFDVPFYQE